MTTRNRHFGSKADIQPRPRDFRSAPEARHWEPARGFASLTIDRVPSLCGLRDRAMHRIDFALTSMVFVADRPRCPSCGEPMWLVRVVQTGPHLSERRFECASCEANDVRIEPD